jgi:2-keto-4-pentenoate hydratase/2-oxohepta-3-ene-1,7-dioic acid hydratase in catechol pathway
VAGRRPRRRVPTIDRSDRSIHRAQVFLPRRSPPYGRDGDGIGAAPVRPSDAAGRAPGGEAAEEATVRLVTYDRPGPAHPDPRVGILHGDHVLDVADGCAAADGLPDGAEPPRTMLALLQLGDAGPALARDLLDRVVGGTVDPAGFAVAVQDVRLRAPLPRPRSLRDFMLVEEHVENSFGRVPAEWYRIPVHWKGNPDTVFGPGDEVPWPHYTDKLDYELEVAAVLGRPAHRVGPDEAAACIAGFTIFNDWSARDIQFREMSVGIGPAFGKDFATSLGPCLTTADSIDITTARMVARVDGEDWSEGSLGSMRFSFPDVISLLSAEQPLHPGDVLGSGTVGRGCGLELDRWIRPGSVVELEVEGIGVLRNTVGAKLAAPPGVIDLAAAGTTSEENP